jgi:hypothetical protein
MNFLCLAFVILLSFTYKTHAGFNYGKCLESPIYPGFDANQVFYNFIMNT